jgi:hypothetical protein
MQINIKKLNTEFNWYDKLLTEYEEITYKYYNELKLAKDFWKVIKQIIIFITLKKKKIKLIYLFMD